MSGKYIIKKWFDGMWMLYVPGGDSALCTSHKMAIEVMDRHATFGTFENQEPPC
jgi:hypothetical protein